MNKLHAEDIAKCLKKIPSKLKDIVKAKYPGSVFIAGGFIRSVIMHEEIRDIDVFARDSELAKEVANGYSNSFTPPARLMETKNAITLPTKKPVVQVISRWHFSEPKGVIGSFDFVHCCAVIWWDGENWDSACHDQYYRDLAGKHLTYTAPTRMEDPGGSMVRVLKFMRRGFRIDAENLGRVMARVSDASEKVLDEEDREATNLSILVGLGDYKPKARTEARRGKSIAKLMTDVYPRNGV